MMLFSHAHGRGVVDLSTADTLGTVAACVVAPFPARIAGLRLKTRGPGRHTLVWDDVQAFGPDAVTVRAAGSVRSEKDTEPGDPTARSHDPVGKPVLTETGVGRGTVTDIDFDEESGHIRRLMTAEEEISGERLLGVGNHAVIVSQPG
jgi:uncharacterized protein YrrD